MIKIIKHKAQEKTIAVRFICNCGCEFWADNGSILEDETVHVSHFTVYSAICPDCKNKICSVNKPIDRAIIFNK